MAVDAKASAAFIQHGDKYLADIYQLAGSVWRTWVLSKFSAATVVHIRKMRLSSLIVATRPPVVWQVSFG
ncbi:putative inner membrane protein [Escherichia coli]|uniref:Putative inner membrane protein n=1 Tax=Escherichia coli TaxID=562 RepID=A0A377AI21_ECOLX|nr:putative inner membrane protein [Escherichia coli]